MIQVLFEEGRQRERKKERKKEATHTHNRRASQLLEIHLLCLLDHSYSQCLHPIFHLHMFLDRIYWYLSITFFSQCTQDPFNPLNYKIKSLLSWALPKTYGAYIDNLVLNQQSGMKIWGTLWCFGKCFSNSEILSNRGRWGFLNIQK